VLNKPDSTGYTELLPGILMKPLTHGENSLLCEFRLRQGTVIPAHQHSQEQTGYLVHGSLKFFGDEGEAIIEPGYSWNFRGGVIHGAEALADSIAIEVFSPPREDYLTWRPRQEEARSPREKAGGGT
jgi:quercetin dioxygenase-like cupin family protein